MSTQVHAHAFPFHRPLPRPLQPGLELGTELTHRESQRWSLVQPLGLGWFSAGGYGGELQLHTHALGRYSAPWGGFADAGLGAGARLGFSGRQVLVQAEEGWTETRDWGRPGLQFGFSLGVGQHLEAGPVRVRLGLRYRWFALFPYLMPAAPFMAHSLLGLELGVSS